MAEVFNPGFGMFPSGLFVFFFLQGGGGGGGCVDS